MRCLVLLSCLAVACGGVHSPAPPAVFPLKPAWTTPVSDFVEGALATDRRHLFAITRDGIVRAFDPATGRVLWQSEQRSGTLAASETGLILRLVDGTVKSLTPAKGTVQWEAASGIVGDLPPALDGDRVFIAGKGMAALDISTGRVIWSAPADPTVTAPPVAAGSRLLAGEEDGTLRCRDRASGVSLWRLRTGSALLAPPVVDPEQRRLYLGTTDRRILEVGLEKGEKGWAWKVGADVESPGLIHERRVLFTAFDAVLYALDRGNGNLVWRRPVGALPRRRGPVGVQRRAKLLREGRDRFRREYGPAGREPEDHRAHRDAAPPPRRPALPRPERPVRGRLRAGRLHRDPPTVRAPGPRAAAGGVTPRVCC